MNAPRVPRNASASADSSAMSATATSHPRAAHSQPFRESRTMARTFCPAFSSVRATCPPTCPVMPVTAYMILLRKPDNPSLDLPSRLLIRYVSYRIVSREAELKWGHDEQERERPKAKAPGGRPRDEEATDRIQAVALELAEENGFDALTVEGVAARAGVGKMTIYRRWPNVWAVVVDAILAEVTRVSPVMERATARESLTESMKLVANSFRGRQGRLLRPLIGRAQVDDTLRAAIDERWLSPRRGLSREIVRRGIERGELRPGLDPDVVIDALYGPLYHRLLLPYGERRSAFPTLT